MSESSQSYRWRSQLIILIHIMSTTSTPSNINTNTHPDTNAASSFPSLVGGSGTVYPDPTGEDAAWVRKVDEGHPEALHMIVSARPKDRLVELTCVQAQSIKDLRRYRAADPVISPLFDVALTSPGFDSARRFFQDSTVNLSQNEALNIAGTILARKTNPDDCCLDQWIQLYREGCRIPDPGESSEVQSVGGSSEEGEIDDTQDCGGSDPEGEGEESEEGEEYDNRYSGWRNHGARKEANGSRNTRYDEKLDYTPYTGVIPQAAWQCT
jgi:hypothetical protein